MPTVMPRLTVEDVDRFVRERCFVPASGRIGAEAEWLTFLSSDHDAHPDHARVRSIVDDSANVHSRVTYEPGGQFELSSPAMPSIGSACKILASDIDIVRSGLTRAGIELCGMGLDPIRGHHRVLDQPRYRAMETYFDGGGPAGRRMMTRTAAVQVNLDAGESNDIDARWRAAHLLGPVLVAMFANSPFIEGRAAEFKSARMATWWAMDRTRTAPAITTGRAVEDWTRYLLDANVMLIRLDDETFIPLSETLTFERWIAQGHEFGYPDLDDLEYHITTLFPPVRARGWLELRMIDALPDPLWRAAVAVSAALMDDPEARDRACRAAAGTAHMWVTAFTDGLAHPSLARAANLCISAAIDAFPRLAVDPQTVAATVGYHERFTSRGRSPADDLLRAFEREDSIPLSVDNIPVWI